MAEEPSGKVIQAKPVDLTEDAQAAENDKEEAALSAFQLKVKRRKKQTML